MDAAMIKPERTTFVRNIAGKRSRVRKNRNRDGWRKTSPTGHSLELTSAAADNMKWEEQLKETGARDRVGTKGEASPLPQTTSPKSPSRPASSGVVDLAYNQRQDSAQLRYPALHRNKSKQQ